MYVLLTMTYLVKISSHDIYVVAYHRMFVIYILLSLYFFFFSSRRRHTRYWRDWSSDVCSSDLRPGPASRFPAPRSRQEQHRVAELVPQVTPGDGPRVGAVDQLAARHRLEQQQRSGERRVGKEGRSRWSPDH